MELPIKSPSKISYADEIVFKDLLNELSKTDFTGFLRFTHNDSEEGHILFEAGQPIAASFEDYLQNEAFDKIENIFTKQIPDDIVEFFDLKPSQLSYLKDLNKLYVLTPKEDEKPAPKKESESDYGDDGLYNPKKASYRMTAEELRAEAEKERHSEEPVKAPEPEPVPEPKPEPVPEPKVEPRPTLDPIPVKPDEEDTKEEAPVNRADLLAKYGLKEMNDEESDKILNNYAGDDLSETDMERMELTLMNKIKKTILSMPKINNAEVSVFLEYTNQLHGKVKVITQYETKGLFSRLMGESKAVQNLKLQILDLVEMEIRKNFREYPEIVDNFDINIEIMQ